LIPADGIAMLLAKLAKSFKQEVSIKPRHRNLLPLDPHPERAVLEHKLIVISSLKKRPYGLDYPRAEQRGA